VPRTGTAADPPRTAKATLARRRAVHAPKAPSGTNPQRISGRSEIRLQPLVWAEERRETIIRSKGRCECRGECGRHKACARVQTAWDRSISAPIVLDAIRVNGGVLALCDQCREVVA